MAVILLALIAAAIAVPRVYVPLMTFFAPRPDIQISASPSTFTALAGGAANTSIMLKSLRGSATQVALTVEQTPPCNGACTVPLLQVTLSPNLLSLSPDGTGISSFMVNPYGWADPGSYDFIVTATPSQGLAVTTIVTVHLAGFNITANPSVLNFTRASYILSTVTVNSVYGYSGNVVLLASSEATGPMARFSHQSLILPAGGSATTTLNVTSDAQGSYKIMVDGNSGKLFQTIWLPATTSPTSSAADFSLTTIPSNTNLSPGQRANFTIEVSSLNGCICIVRLSVSPTISSGGPDPLIVTVSPSVSTNSTLTVITGQYATPGPVTVTITGTSGSLGHSIDIILHIIS